MAKDVDKHKNNTNECKPQAQWQKTVISTTIMHVSLVSIRTMQIRVLSTRRMAEDDDKHKNNDRRRC